MGIILFKLFRERYTRKELDRFFDKFFVRNILANSVFGYYYLNTTKRTETENTREGTRL